MGLGMHLTEVAMENILKFLIVDDHDAVREGTQHVVQELGRS
ncbi:MAG: hypothetical protein ACI910_003251 [Oleispira sp.]|jgi:hypothetical protein